jgi:hypothetical protein
MSDTAKQASVNPSIIAKFVCATQKRGQNRRVIWRLAFGQPGPHPRFVQAHVMGEAQHLCGQVQCQPGARAVHAVAGLRR